MQEKRTDSKFQLIVTGTRHNGRRWYEEESKRPLARVCLQPGVNAHLLRKWVVASPIEPGRTDFKAPTDRI